MTGRRTKKPFVDRDIYDKAIGAVKRQHPKAEDCQAVRALYKKLLGDNGSASGSRLQHFETQLDTIAILGDDESKRKAKLVKEYLYDMPRMFRRFGRKGNVAATSDDEARERKEAMAYYIERWQTLDRSEKGLFEAINTVFPNLHIGEEQERPPKIIRTPRPKRRVAISD